MATRLPLVGESKEECRKRIMESCRAEWSANTPETQVLKEVWRQKARTMNKECKTASKNNLVVLDKPTQSLSAVVPIELDEQEEPKRFSQLMLASSPSADASSGFGVLGMGDDDFALNKETLDAAYGTGFVKQFSGQWRQRTGSTIGEPRAFPEHTVRVGCLEGYNFCHKTIKSMRIFNQINCQIRQFVANHRRKHLVGKKNMGPKVGILHSLLILKDMNLSLGKNTMTYFRSKHQLYVQSQTCCAQPQTK